MTEDGATPMMAQYLEIKARHPDALLFYRMGDFYEMFFDDAVAASDALGIALTKRGRHLGADIAMCGVPVHSSEAYLLTLIRKGFRVAIAEQMEDPAEAKKRGAKSVVARDVVRLVTPGTLTEDALLEPRRNNFLAALCRIRDETALAWCDISTGEVRVVGCAPERVGAELARLDPRELLIGEAADAPAFEGALTRLPASSFDSAAAERRLCATFGVATLDAFGAFGRAEVSAMGALLAYLDLTQRGRLPRLVPPVRERAGSVMLMDASTRANLEIVVSQAGGREGTLLAAMDRTVTGAGGRLLERRLSAPSAELATIHARLEAVRVLVTRTRLRADLREALREVPDMERAASRLGLGRGGPRDLAAIRSGLEQAERIAGMLAGDLPAVLAGAAEALGGHRALGSLLCGALAPSPPVALRDGGVIAEGHDPDLDETRRLRDEGRGVIAGMQADYAGLTAIPSLKIKHNNVLGYFIDVTSLHAERMMSPPLSETFRHRQTTAGQVRFTTAALSELENRILNAGQRAQEIERGHFEALAQVVVTASAGLARTAAGLAELDLAAALADLAVAEDWVEPLVDESRAFGVAGGRHPVVERALRRGGGAPFVANDCDLGVGEGAALWLLTGPNMAGKSTFLRQNALMAVMAQAGSFVPAVSAHIGLVGQVFSRVGASDDLSRGRSTFMVEMVETAAILHQADARSFVILDEIGRGTATYDGLSIAWATLEHLHDANRCRGLFATHYHEMTALSARLAGVENATVRVKEWEGDVIFLHEVGKGAADRSYGVQVARLAGLPEAVIARARDVLRTLEQSDREGGGKRQAMIDDLPLFRVQAAPPVTPRGSAVEEALAAVRPDALSPFDALKLVYDLKGLCAPGS